MKSDNGLLYGLLIGGGLTLLGTIISSLINFASQYLSSRFLLKLEWQKYIQPSLFKAYDGLYRFISFARTWYPPSDERKEFLELINSHHFKEVRGNKIFFNSEIREIIEECLSVYNSITDTDSCSDPKGVLDTFWNDLNKLLNRLETIVDKQTKRFNLF